MQKAVVLFGHGTVRELDELPEFVTNIRRGHAPPPELIADLRHRYLAIGGKSPFNDIARELAAGVERALGVPTVMAARLWHPNADETLRDLAARGVTAAAFVPLAQHSAAVYGAAADEACARLVASGATMRVASASNWGQTPALLDAYAASVARALAAVPSDVRAKTTTLFSAHSLPQAIIDGGDPYEREFRASVDGVVARLSESGVRPMVCFQSQGASSAGPRPMKWIGPDLKASLDAIAARGDTHVLFAPIGFLADHVEVLYDLDVEAKQWAEERKLSCSRAASLNASPAMIDVVAAIARDVLAKLDP